MQAKTKDLYEASYYLMNGAKIDRIEVKRFKSRVVGKAHDFACLIWLDNVDRSNVALWKGHIANGNLRVFANERQQFKKRIRKAKKDYFMSKMRPTPRNNR